MKGKKKKPASFYVLVVLILLLFAIALAAPLLAPNDPHRTDLSAALQGSSAKYPLGTDSLGRCMLSRLLYGARVSIFSSLCIITIVFVLGTCIGVVSGYFGGVLDMILMKVVTLVQAFPKFILAIAIAGVLGIGIGNMIFALCLVEWAEYARISRSLAWQLRNKTYIKAAKICGESEPRILFCHVLPGVVRPLVVNASLGISSMIMEVAALSYLGVGVKSPMAEWGAMMNNGKDYLQTSPALVLLPGVAIFLVSAIFNMFGDKLRDALDRG